MTSIGLRGSIGLTSLKREQIISLVDFARDFSVPASKFILAGTPLSSPLESSSMLPDEDEDRLLLLLLLQLLVLLLEDELLEEPEPSDLSLESSTELSSEDDSKSLSMSSKVLLIANYKYNQNKLVKIVRFKCEHQVNKLTFSSTTSYNCSFNTSI